MKKRTVAEMLESKNKIERGEVVPARVWKLKSNGKGGFVIRKGDPQKFQKAQKKSWNKSIVATRQKLGLSQTGFAGILGISVRTLHHWEQGTRAPSGAARVLLKVAERHPEVVMEAVE
jgi:putative transcriptional regulator